MISTSVSGNRLGGNIILQGCKLSSVVSLQKCPYVTDANSSENYRQERVRKEKRKPVDEKIERDSDWQLSLNAKWFPYRTNIYWLNNNTCKHEWRTRTESFLQHPSNCIIYCESHRLIYRVCEMDVPICQWVVRCYFLRSTAWTPVPQTNWLLHTTTSFTQGSNHGLFSSLPPSQSSLDFSYF